MSLSFLKFQKNSKPFEAFYRVTCQLESYIMLTSKQKFSHSIDSLYKNANFNLMSTEYRAQADGSHCMCIRTDNIDIQGRVCIRSSCSLVEDINFLSKWECTTTIDLQASFVTSLTHLTLNHLEIVRRKGPLTVMLFLPRCNPLPGVWMMRSRAALAKSALTCIEKNPTEKPTENPTEIPYTKKKSKNG